MKRQTVLKLRLISLGICSAILFWGVYYNLNYHIHADCDYTLLDSLTEQQKSMIIISNYDQICDVSNVPIIQWIAQLSGFIAFFGTVISLGLVIDVIDKKSKTVKQSKITDRHYNSSGGL